jgi:hypothetical protein
MARVAVAEVIAKLDIGRHAVADAHQAIEDFLAHVLECHRPDAFEHPELDRRIPLDGELIVRNRRHDLVQLAQQGCLVDGFDRGHGRRSDESRNRC